MTRWPERRAGSLLKDPSGPGVALGQPVAITAQVRCRSVSQADSASSILVTRSTTWQSPSVPV